MDTPARSAERTKTAKHFEKQARLSAFCFVFLILIMAIGIATGATTGNWRLNGALAVTAIAVLGSVISSRSIARRLHEHAVPKRSTPAVWARAIAAIVVSLGLGGLLGYLLGGWILAVAFPAFTAALAGLTAGIGIRRRRRINA